MDMQDQHLEHMTPLEEKNEDVKLPVNDNQEKITNGGTRLHQHSVRPPRAVKRTASEAGTRSAKGERKYTPLIRATSINILPKDEEVKSSDSETEDVVNDGIRKPCSCSSPHDGRQLVNLDLNIHVHQLFNMIFTQSSFYQDFHSARKTTDIVQSAWEDDPESGGKKKQVELTVSLNKAVGPKTTRVTEKLIMRPCSKPGQLYSIDLCAYQTGFRYCDAFYCFTHFCLRDTTQDSESKENNMNAENTSQTSNRDSQISSVPPNFTCNLSVYSQLVYTKSVWTPVKVIIEKSSWVGLEEFYESLSSKLKEACDQGDNDAQNISDYSGDGSTQQRKRKNAIAGPGIADTVKDGIDHSTKSLKASRGRKRKKESPKDRVSWLLLTITLTSFALLNIFLCYKLKTLEGITVMKTKPSSGINLETFISNPGTYKEWLALSINMGNYNDAEMESWRNTLDKAMDLLDEVEVLLKNLTIHIPMEAKHRVMIASLQKDTHSTAAKDI